MNIKQILWLSATACLAAGVMIAQGPPAGPAKGKAAKAAKDPFQSPASPPRPKAATKQTYPETLVKTGEATFTAQCGFCHGRDATGGESGPDLTRSEIVAGDVNGNQIAPIVREGVPDEGMPSFRLSDAEMSAVVAFLHTQQSKFESLLGGRRGVNPEDLLTGNADAGRAYFNGAGGCANCHSATGDLKGIATRFQGLQLMQRMLYPATVRPTPARPKATVTTPEGGTVTAPIAAEDEFSLTLLIDDQRQVYQKSAVRYTIDNPLEAHFEQLGKYTDADLHNVYAYLVTLQ